MSIDLRPAYITIAILVGLLGCGSYSAPDDQPGVPDSTGDSTASAPPGYSQW
jgi:hypothetical protein